MNQGRIRPTAIINKFCIAFIGFALLPINLSQASPEGQNTQDQQNRIESAQVNKERDIAPNKGVNTGCTKTQSHVTTLSRGLNGCKNRQDDRINAAADRNISRAQARRGLGAMLMAIGAECAQGQTNCNLKVIPN